MIFLSILLSGALMLSDIQEQYIDIMKMSDQIQMELEEVYTQTQMNQLAKKKRDIWESEVLVLVNYIKSTDPSIMKRQEKWEYEKTKRISEDLEMYSGSIYEALYYMEEAAAYKERALVLLRMIRKD